MFQHKRPPLITLLKSCKSLHSFQQIHAQILQKGLHNNLYLITNFISRFFDNSNSIDYATSVFNSFAFPPTCLWNAFLKGHCSYSSLLCSLSLLSSMRLSGVSPDNYTFSPLIKCCAGEFGGYVGFGVHGLVLKYGFVDNVYVGSSLVDFYAKCGLIGNARKVFDEMSVRNVVSWTSLMLGYLAFGDLGSARKVFDEMPKRDQMSWNVMISAYVRRGELSEARKLFDEMSCLMNAKCGNMEQAMYLFNKMPKRDLVSYCSMIRGHSIHGQGAKGVKLFYEMLSEGITPDTVAFNVVLMTCSRARLVEEASCLFDMMRNRYCITPSPEHYACMVDLLGRAGHLEAAFDILKMMPVESHAESWGALLGACRLHCDIKLAEVVAKQLVELVPRNAGNFVVLSNVYAAADRWLDVSKVWNQMDGRGLRKISGRSWV